MAQSIPMYLQLPQQLGGTRFGPFHKRIDVGSDAKLNQLVLDSRHGIFPNHAVAAQLEPGVLTVQPSGPQAQVFVVPNGQQHPWPVRGPVQVRPGDTLIFGTPHGPQFQVWVDPRHLKSKDQVLAEARAKGGEAGALHALGSAIDRVMGAPKAGGISGEVARRGQSEMLTTGPGKTAYDVYTRAKSGVFTNPRNIVAMFIALVGLISTGGLTCSGALYTLYRVVMQ